MKAKQDSILYNREKEIDFMKMSKKILAAALVVVMMFSSFAVPVSAVSDEFMNKTYMVLEKALYSLVRIIDFMLPSADWYGRWADKDDYVPEFFFEGDGEDAPEDAAWSVGYGANSLIDGLDIMNGEYFLAGTLEPFKGRVPVKVINDQRVRAFAINDGGGTVVYAVIDGFGISRGDVQKIREMFSKLSEAEGVVSVNVSALHQHSCIDTLGMNVPLIPALIRNTAVNLLGLDESYLIKKNQEFMANLYAKVTDAMKQAVRTMETGTLSYGNVNIKEYIYDGRTPDVFDEYVHRLKFVPDNEESKETWIVSAAMHCTGLGAGPDVLTADYPYYIEQELKDDANVVFVLGAQLAIKTEHDDIHKELEADPTLADEPYILYGKRIGEKIRTIDNDKELIPELNVAHKEIFLDADNPILTLAARQGILESVIVKLPFHRYQIVTEIGYLEFGGEVGVILAPGELAPEIVLGGAETEKESWTSTSWDYAPLKDMADVETLFTFGLCNDQAGYILPDNEYRTLFTENEEVNVASRTAGSKLAEGYTDLFVESLRWKDAAEKEAPEETYYEKYVEDIVASGNFLCSTEMASGGSILGVRIRVNENFVTFSGRIGANGLKLDFIAHEEDGETIFVMPILFRYAKFDDFSLRGMLEEQSNGLISINDFEYLGLINGKDYVCEVYEHIETGELMKIYFNSKGVFKIVNGSGDDALTMNCTIKAEEVMADSGFTMSDGYKEIPMEDLQKILDEYGIKF